MFFFIAHYFLIFSVSLWPLTGTREGVEVKKTSLDLPKASEDFNSIRISLGSPVSEVTINTASPYKIVDSEKKVISQGAKLHKTHIKAAMAGIQIGGQPSSKTIVWIQSLGEGIHVNDRLYRQKVEIRLEPNGKISLINEIAIEDYLKGVLPLEVSPKWSPEALKAQAVASRTFALFKAIENRNEKFALSQDVLSQVYGGRSSENPATNLAVEQTRGQILTYQGKIFPAYFHSTCGGATTHAEYMWDVEKHPALSGVKCSFCKGSKHYRWRVEFKREEIESRLAKHGFRLVGIRKITQADIDESGRAKSFVVEDSVGKKKIRANDFRLWIDPMKLKSTLIFSIEQDGENFVFEGKGWGHGVGLCQYGMKTLADLGYGYQDILKYYYDGADITRVNIERAPAAFPSKEDPESF